MLLNDGASSVRRILYYLGTTLRRTAAEGPDPQPGHTPARGENPVFGGHEVGIGFAGTCDEEGALLDATALAGKRSLRMTAILN